MRVAAAGVLGYACCGNVAPSQVNAQPATTPSLKRSTRPALISTCVITKDVKGLVAFYEPVLKLKAKWSGKDYAEFATGAGVLAIFSANAQEKYIPGSAEAARNRTIILEFEVADVDAEYRRLKDLVKTWSSRQPRNPGVHVRFIFAMQTETSSISMRMY